VKITIDIDQQDIANASSEAFCGLLSALKEISSSSKAEAENEIESAEKSAPAKLKQATATKVSEPKKNTGKTASPKVSEEKPVEAKPEKVEKAEKVAEKTEDKTEEAPAKDEKPAKESKKADKPDRAAISERLKEIAKNGKAEGKPKKIKALLQEYGVDKVPDLPDDKLEEFLEKVEAL